jgi:hypothetical protein
VAAAITEKLEADVSIEPGSRGEFTVWVGDIVVARKTMDGFPTVEECVEAVAASTG